MVYHLTMEERAECAAAAKTVRKNKYLKVLATVQQAIAQLPEPSRLPGRVDQDSNPLIAQQLQILEGLLLKETL